MPRFFERPYPNANAILLGTVLVDPGDVSDTAALLAWLGDTSPGLVVNTHWHTDHSGANHLFQARGVPIALPAPEAERVNAADPDACRAHWLHQRFIPFTADRALHPGDDVCGWTVIALPGHTNSQIGLLRDGVLLCADALSDRDIGWLDLDADSLAIDQAEATIDLIASLDLHLALPGHGPAITDLPAALARARRRLAGFRADPTRIGWHACKRIFTHGLMMEGGLLRDAVAPYLDACPWFHDHARRAFGVSPDAFRPMLVDEMVRGAARWDGDRLIPTGPFVLPRYSASTPGSPAFL